MTVPLTARHVACPVAGNFDPRCRSESWPVFWLMIFPVTVPSMLLDVYTYWFVGSCTMQRGPAPTGYGLFVSPMGRGCSLPDVESIAKADTLLVAVDWLLVVELFTTYRYLPLLSTRVLTGLEAPVRFGTGPPVRVFRAQPVPVV